MFLLDFGKKSRFSAVVIVTCLWACHCIGCDAYSMYSTIEATYPVDTFDGVWATFDGIGAISGGGVSIDYRKLSVENNVLVYDGLHFCRSDEYAYRRV
jgi:hypothetical protein